MEHQLVKRLKSFAWRLGSVIAIAGLNFVIENIAGLGLPVWSIGIIGLALGEITKYLNRKKVVKTNPKMK